MRKVLFAILCVCGFAYCAYAEAVFTVTTINMPAGTTFSFQISAAGNFTINWGDINCSETKTDSNGTPCIQEITKTDTTNTTYGYKYNNSGIYHIGISGKATYYNTSTMVPAISFANNTNLHGIDGNLGYIFSSIEKDSVQINPTFYTTFSYCSNLTSKIPQDLFKGLYGKPTGRMFQATFRGTSITGEIPENLFADISGEVDYDVFNETFSLCTGLTGHIPAGLFKGIKGALSTTVFAGTFYGCSGLTGQIPPMLFSGIKGPVQRSDFLRTFAGCTGLTGFIPAELFDGITGTAYYSQWWGCYNGEAFCAMFQNTNLLSECPDGAESVSVTGYNYTKMDGKAVCRCKNGYDYTGVGTCAQICPNPNIKYLRTSTGIKIPLYSAKQIYRENPTNPSLVIENSDGQCFGILAPGERPNSIIIEYNGEKYHVAE